MGVDWLVVTNEFDWLGRVAAKRSESRRVEKQANNEIIMAANIFDEDPGIRDTHAHQDDRRKATDRLAPIRTPGERGLWG